MQGAAVRRRHVSICRCVLCVVVESCVSRGQRRQHTLSPAPCPTHPTHPPHPPNTQQPHQPNTTPTELSQSCRGMDSSALAYEAMKSCALPGMVRAWSRSALLGWRGGCWVLGVGCWWVSRKCVACVCCESSVTVCCVTVWFQCNPVWSEPVLSQIQSKLSPRHLHVDGAAARDDVGVLQGAPGGVLGGSGGCGLDACDPTCVWYVTQRQPLSSE